jgi:hypothetical protein
MSSFLKKFVVVMNTQRNCAVISPLRLTFLCEIEILISAIMFHERS